MSASLTIHFAEIGDLTDALMELINENFFQTDPEFTDTQIESEIDTYVSQFGDGLSCILEFPYVDKVYRDSYYYYYSSKHTQYKRDTIRVSLFSHEFEITDFVNPQQHEAIKAAYLGFFVIRPTHGSLNGRAILNPVALDLRDIKICAAEFEALVLGVKLSALGFPHSSQDGETIKCAETTIWTIMEYFGNKYAEYKPTLPSQIHRVLEKYSYQRQVPSNGLTMEQISFALKEFGFATRFYSTEPYDTSLYSLIDTYIESGIPVIIGLEGDNIGHVIVAIGKQQSDYSFEKITSRKFNGRGREVIYFDTSDLPAKYVIQDDNLPPYQLITLDAPGDGYPEGDEARNYYIDSAIVPLYTKINLEAYVVKELFIEIIRNNVLGFDFEDGFILRCFLASSRSFKNHIARLSQMDETLKMNIQIISMPKFIWCAEVYPEKGFKGEGSDAIGLIVLDATEANLDGLDALIFAGYPDKCVIFNNNTLKHLTVELINYSYFSNLK